MATQLTAVFSLIDKMSEKLDAIAERGMNIADQLERAASAASSAFDAAESGGVAAARRRRRVLPQPG